MRRITLIAAGDVRLTATLPASVTEYPRVVCTCDPRDQVERHRRVYFERDRSQGDSTYVQVEVVDVDCKTVEVEQ